MCATYKYCPILIKVWLYILGNTETQGKKSCENYNFGKMNHPNEYTGGCKDWNKLDPHIFLMRIFYITFVDNVITVPDMMALIYNKFCFINSSLEKYSFIDFTSFLAYFVQ